MLREAPLALLREDQVAVAQDVELAVLAGNRLRGDPGSLDLGRETRGPAVVAASGGAVVDLDGHAPEGTGPAEARSRTKLRV